LAPLKQAYEKADDMDVLDAVAESRKLKRGRIAKAHNPL
jgi:hypothetical protein